jgi:hypothetical protein
MTTDLKVGKWDVMRRTLFGGGAGSIMQRTLLDANGVQWAVTKARSTAKHSNGVEYLIYRNGVLVDYSRKLKGAMSLAEEFAAGTMRPQESSETA